MIAGGIPSNAEMKLEELCKRAEHSFEAITITVGGGI